MISRQTVKFTLTPEAQASCSGNRIIYPKHVPGDAATDLRWFSTTRQRRSLMPNEVVLFHTGLLVELPANVCGIIIDRSGRAAEGIHVVGGLVDPGYRGEIKVALTCTDRAVHYLRVTERIAQLVLVPFVAPLWEWAGTLTETERGPNGFGSTGDD